MSWTEDRVGLLRELWSEGLSASRIAERLGGITRNAVIGKAHRLALASRPSPIRGTPGQSRPRAKAPPALRPPVRPPFVPVAHPRHAVNGAAPAATAAEDRLRNAGLELNRAALRAPPPYPLAANADGPACKWPIGDPGEPEFHFCGAPSVTGRPYCPDHCSVAYIRKDRPAA